MNVISSSVGTIFELLMLLVSGVVVFLPYLLSVGTGPLSQLWTLGLLLIPATLIGLHPGIFNHVLRWSLALVGCKDVTIKLTIQQLASVLLTECFFWRLKEKYISGLQSLFFAMWFDMEYNQHLRVCFDSQQSNA